MNKRKRKNARTYWISKNLSTNEGFVVKAKVLQVAVHCTLQHFIKWFTIMLYKINNIPIYILLFLLFHSLLLIYGH